MKKYLQLPQYNFSPIRTLLTLCVIAAPVLASGKTLDITNNAAYPIDFRFYYNCFDITPEKFTLQPAQTTTVNITPDQNNKCSTYKDSNAVLIGGQSSLHSAEGFTYMLNYSKEKRESPWTCDTNAANNSYFCHYLSPNSDSAYSTEISNDKITLLDEEPGRIIHLINKSNYYIKTNVAFAYSHNSREVILKPNQKQDLKIEANASMLAVELNMDSWGKTIFESYFLTPEQAQQKRYENFNCTKTVDRPGINFCYIFSPPTSNLNEMKFKINETNGTNIVFSNR